MKFKRVSIHYPMAVVEDNQIVFLGQLSKKLTDNKIIVGAGELVSDVVRKAYGFRESDVVDAEVSIDGDEFGLGATLNFETEAEITALWCGCVSSWRQIVEEGA